MKRISLVLATLVSLSLSLVAGLTVGAVKG